MYITTSLGYHFETDQEIRAGSMVTVPLPTDIETVSMEEAHVRFWATMYARGLEWDNSILGPYNIGAEQDNLPDQILRLERDKLIIFINAIFDAGGKPILHKSGSGRTDIPEIWFNSKHKGVVDGVQYILLRLGVRSKVRFTKHRRLWSVKVAGHGAFLRLMEFLTDITEPLLKARINRVLERSEAHRFSADPGVVRDRVDMVSEFAPRKSRW